MLKIKNSLSGQLEPFTPIDRSNVGVYVCGMTVYDHCHVGHARSLIVFDLLNRFLRHLYGDGSVTFVRNITDIDDKIIARSIERDEDFATLTHRHIESMREDCAALGILPPDHEPRATEHMGQIVGMIERLEQRGFAYRAPSGDVYFQVSAFPGYGKLSNRDVASQISGYRIDASGDKRSDADFILWKMAKPGEPAWESPWGAGRPGWHIECSAMSSHLLGERFDIHGGGMDLKFPHHENEIAQSEACFGHRQVNYWMHNGFVQVDGEKMSKSLGNFRLIRDLLAKYPGESIRMFILSSHYRSPLNFSAEALDAANASLGSLYRALRRSPPAPGGSAPAACPFHRRFLDALGEDLNTPAALAVLFELARRINAGDDSPELSSTLLAAGRLIGLLNHAPASWRSAPAADARLADERVVELIAERAAARGAKDWATADRLRDLLLADGIEIEDGADGTRWSRR